ncbi:MAG: hypothetical protein WA989_03080 [Henriciella sp.]|uniref:hypothetical protein n=1 Tax=Henriciella sp. TaxID=1968823 RepID=UPI003C75888D
MSKKAQAKAVSPADIAPGRFAAWRYGAYDDRWIGPRAIMDLAGPCEVELIFFVPEIDTTDQQKTVEIFLNGKRAQKVKLKRGEWLEAKKVACKTSPSRIEVRCETPEPGRFDDLRDICVHVPQVRIDGNTVHVPIFEDLIVSA